MQCLQDPIGVLHDLVVRDEGLGVHVVLDYRRQGVRHVLHDKVEKSVLLLGQTLPLPNPHKSGHAA